MTDEGSLTVESRIDELCGHAVRLLDAAHGRPKSVRVRAGELSVEVEWAEQVTAPNGLLPVVPGGGATPANGHDTAASAQPEETGPDGTFTIDAPLVGTFYRAPAPGERPFVEVGDLVEEGQQVAIVEAMKLMNAVEADRRGRVVEMVAADGVPVEYGAPLFVLEVV